MNEFAAQKIGAIEAWNDFLRTRKRIKTGRTESILFTDTPEEGGLVQFPHPDSEQAILNRAAGEATEYFEGLEEVGNCRSDGYMLDAERGLKYHYGSTDGEEHYTLIEEA